MFLTESGIRLGQGYDWVGRLFLLHWIFHHSGSGRVLSGEIQGEHVSLFNYLNIDVWNLTMDDLIF